MKFEFEIEAFGRKVDLDWEGDARRMITHLGNLVFKSTHPFITKSCRPYDISITDNDYFCDEDVIKWLADKFNIDMENVYSELASEDVEWAKTRNKDHDSIYYRKYKFNKTAKNVIREEAERLQTMLKIELEKFKAQEESERRRMRENI